MQKLVKSVTMSLTAIVALSTFAYGQFAWTSSPTPSTIPSNAFINSASNDSHFFFQSVTFTATLGVTNGQDIIISMPADGSITVADPDGDGTFNDGISLLFDDASGAITTFAVGGATATTINITVGGAAAAAGDFVTVIFPIVTDSSLSATGAKVAYTIDTSDDLLDGVGTPTTADSVTFTSNIRNAVGVTYDGTFLKDNGAVGTTSTDPLGEYLPGDDGTAFSAVTPNFIVDVGTNDGDVTASDEWNGVVVATPLNQVDNDAGEVAFKVWASQTAGLDYINTGVATALFRHNAGVEVLADNFVEAATMADALNTAGLAAGIWYIYVTSDATADWALAESDTLNVIHDPVFFDPSSATPSNQYDNVTDGAGASGRGQGVDYDGDTVFEPDADDDFAAMFLDTGGIIGRDGLFVVGGNSVDNVRIYWHGRDIDSPSATVQAFLSTSATLASTDITTSGGLVTGLAGATEITTTPLALDAATNFFLFTVSQSPVQAAGDYYFYLVANDGTNQTLQIVTDYNAAGDPVALKITIKHSPFFEFQDVYASVVTADVANDDFVSIDTKTTEEIIISWGGKVNDARDLDASSADPLTIRLYYLLNDLDDTGTNDGTYTTIAADPLDDAVLLAYSGTNSITTIIDTLDGQLDNSFSWDIRSIVTPLSEWSAGAGNEFEYFIYAVVSQGGDKVIVQYNDFAGPGPAAANEDHRGFQFAHSPFMQPKNPVAGSSIELVVRDNYRLEWTAFDLTSTATRVQAFMSATATGTDYSATAWNAAALDAAGDVGVVQLYIDGTNTDGSARPGNTNADGWLASSGGQTIDVSDYTDDLSGTITGTPGIWGSDAQGGNDAGAIGAEYDVWYFIDTDGNGWTTETPTKADGTLFFSVEDPGGAQNLRISPNKHITAVIGETVTFTVEMATGAGGAAVNLIKLAIDIPSTYLKVVDSGSGPFTAGATLTNVALNKSALKGSTYELDGTFDGGSIAASATYVTVATFDIEVTANPGGGTPVHGLVTFADDGGSHVTRLYDTNILPILTSYDSPALDVSLVRPGRMLVTVEVEGRESNQAQDMSLLVVKRGSLEPLTDTGFIAANDTDADGTNGMTVTMDSSGQFTLTDIPTGNYDVIARKSGFLDQKLTDVSVFPGSDATVNFTDGDKMFGGDAAGYDHDNDAGATTLELGNNVIDATTDPAAFTAAMGTTSDSSAWNPLADITGDDLVWADDWAYMVKNQNRTSEGAVYTKSISALNENIIVMIEERTSMGDEVSYAVSMKDLSNLRGYAVALSINPGDWELMSYDDGLANYYSVTNMQKPYGRDELFISATQGFNPIYDEQVELFTFTVRSLDADPEAISIRFAEAIGFDGSLVDAVIEIPFDLMPTRFSLAQNFPNPFNPTTTINFTVAYEANVSLSVYNLLGQEVTSLVSGTMTPGSYRAVWNSMDRTGRKVSTGLYFYRLVVDNKVLATKKMLLLK